MKIQLLSDLHIEFWPKSLIDVEFDRFQTDADVLVLAGDINVGRTNTLDTLKRFSARYPKVIYIRGNHEEYGQRYNDFREGIKFADKLPSNVYFLDPGVVHIDGVTFIGAPLWTDFCGDPLAEQMAAYGINDFGRVHGLKTHHYAEENQKQKMFIKDAYDKYVGRKVIVTHFLPAMECVDPKYTQDPGSIALNKYFANNMGNYIDTLSNTTWMFGHTHESVDMTIGDTRLLCNPYGYFGNELNHNFKANYVVTV